LELRNSVFVGELELCDWTDKYGLERLGTRGTKQTIPAEINPSPQTTTINPRIVNDAQSRFPLFPSMALHPAPCEGHGQRFRKNWRHQSPDVSSGAWRIYQLSAN
jgi:hypothetical protein